MGSLWAVCQRFFWVLLLTNLCSCTHNPSIKLQSNPEEIFDLPKWTWPVLSEKDFKRSYAFDLSINPFYLNADFDQDGLLDIAILVKEKTTEKRGIILIRQADQKLTLFGGGKATQNGNKDFNWLRTWKTETILPAGANSKSRGATIILFPADVNKNAPWLFWDGQTWQWQEK